MKKKTTIATLAKTGMFLIVLALYVEAKVNDIWENGFKAGYEVGYSHGLQQPPQLWKSKHSTGKIVESRQQGQGCPELT